MRRKTRKEDERSCEEEKKKRKKTSTSLTSLTRLCLVKRKKEKEDSSEGSSEGSCSGKRKNERKARRQIHRESSLMGGVTFLSAAKQFPSTQEYQSIETVSNNKGNIWQGPTLKPGPPSGEAIPSSPWHYCVSGEDLSAARNPTGGSNCSTHRHHVHCSCSRLLPPPYAAHNQLTRIPGSPSLSVRPATTTPTASPLRHLSLVYSPSSPSC